MSFGGSVSAMLSTLKNNKRERKSALKKVKDLNATEGDLTYLVDKKASPEEWKALQEKMREKKMRLKRMQMAFLLFSVLFFVILYIFVFT